MLLSGSLAPALRTGMMVVTEPALSSSSVHVSRVGMRHAVLGKSGLASPDALIAGAVSALRAPVARATGSFSFQQIKNTMFQL